MNHGANELQAGVLQEQLERGNLPSLTFKLATVMGEVERIPKSGYNTYFKYHFATEADILEAVRAGLARQHVMLYHECLMERAKFDVIKTRNGETTLVTLPVEFTFVDGESGEHRKIVGIGQATDEADKGIYKALTGAVKYLLLKTFLMSTGDDPDEAAQSAPGAAASPARRDREPMSWPPSGENGEHLTPEQMNALLKGVEGGAAGLKEAMTKFTPDAKQFSDLRQEHYGILVLALTS